MAWNEAIKRELGACGSEVFIGEHVVFTDPKNIFLGDRVRIDPFTLITTKLSTGSNVQICSHAVLSGGSEHHIILENWTFIGYGSKLFCGSEDYSGEHGPVNDFWGHNKVYHGDITIRSFGGIASDVIMMPGTELPIGTCIGAKSFVYSTKDLEPWTVYVGNPLKHHRHRNRSAILDAVQNPEFRKNRG